MTTTTKPILFLAFANDPAHPLPRLADELRGVRAALAPALDAGLCELVEEPYATAEGILAAFRRQRDRIAIFHFAGHAGSDRLLLEAAGGGGQAADAAGLAAFLAQQRGLALVFLNGCSTRDQVQGLLDAGVAAVIATSQAIRDDVAAEFACQFYTGLAAGRDLRAAFDEAAGALRAIRGSSLRDLFDDDAGDLASGKPPWALYERAGADAATGWSLPVAANDPLFGLPDLPSLDLPDRPYRYLDWYRREDAGIFFGRGREIRQLYDRVTATDSAPIVLFYGQSGVGKSSLLAAGLLPRLEASHEVRYMRRDQAGGLLGTLTAALGVAPEEDLAAAWCEAETQAGKPLLIILDQVEELFTRPNPQQPDELADSLTALESLFAGTNPRPRGRLILSFRKEWLAEINQRLAECNLPRAEVFLERLRREGIAEVVAGPRSTARLRAHYRLTVTDALPDLIADDLLADRESPVAPMLAILLADMWGAARARSYDHPAFDEDLYHEFRSRGLSLNDFLGRQLQALHDKLPKVVDSGLVLDLLAYHTTPLGTVEQRTPADLEQTYRHRLDVLPALVQECRDLYLLVDPSQNQPGQPSASRLTHDTLAPHVRKRFDEADAPGQIARRILENQTAEWVGSGGKSLLDEWALAKIKDGQVGMRALTKKEGELIDASQKRIEEQRPPPLDERIFPSGLRVRKLTPGQLLSVSPYVEKSMALGVSGCLGLIFILWSLMCPLSWILASLPALLVGSFTESKFAISTIMCLPLLLISVPLLVYLLIRRFFVTFNLATKNVRIFYFGRSILHDSDSLVTYQVKPNGSTGFGGEVRYRRTILVRTDVMSTEAEVKQELVPFANALNSAMGFVASFSTDQPQAAANLQSPVAKR